MRKADGGSIINLSSMAGVVGLGVATAYQATKGAIRVMTKTVAIQYAKENVKCTPASRAGCLSVRSRYGAILWENGKKLYKVTAPP